MKIVLVFDADDTLWRTEWQYSKALADFFAYLYSEFRDITPNLNSLKQRFDEIDKKLFPEWGISRGRWYMAMREVYHEILSHIERKFGKEYLPTENARIRQEKQIFDIGDQPFNFRGQKWKEHAADLLEELRGREGYSLCLLTCCDEIVWIEKSAFLGVDKYFSNILVIPNRKTSADFVNVSGYGEGKNENILFYSIGNGASDILPALEISERWFGIHIPDRSTSPVFEKELGQDIYSSPRIEHPRVATLLSIAELKNFDFENFNSGSES
ncbi:MAG: hypothetical protein A3B96_03725 [Candidatus Spechtbacteria bacterium RIFCSPHIGHO2_02_FULL_43_15b]|nr:MAG: hypothetical protein A3B96_03725 [Candidatus Spechtbacteria bacterium RIFCSPHIGHO2_02_FULL_43_15b]